MLSLIAFNLVKQMIRRKFFKVPQMTTGEFAEALASKTPPLLFDARSDEEYGVSHLAGAQRWEGREGDNIPKSTPIVVYCSVGYRSALVAQQLMEEGFQQVCNLEGGLFQWVNEGRAAEHNGAGALVHKGQKTQRVHPYNAVWGMLLNPECRL